MSPNNIKIIESWIMFWKVKQTFTFHISFCYQIRVKKFTINIDLWHSTLSHKFDFSMFLCEKCGKNITTAKKWRDHYNNHDEKEIQCYICDIVCMGKLSLKRDMDMSVLRRQTLLILSNNTNLSYITIV